MYKTQPNLYKVFIMETMAVSGKDMVFFSDLLIVLRFPGRQAQYLGQNKPMTKGRICI